MKVIKQFEGVPNGAIYPVTYMPGDECPPELEGTMQHYADGTHAAAPTSGTSGAPALLPGGPTIAQWLAYGYAANSYPPEGYAPVSSPEEVAAAIALEDDAAKRQQEEAVKRLQEADDEDDGSMTVAQLREALTAKGIAFPSNARKADLVALLPKD